MSKFIIWFKNADLNKSSLIGGVAARLGELYSKNYPVPVAFVITSHMFKQFLADSGVEQRISAHITQLDSSDIKGITDASNHIRNLIRGSELSVQLKESILNAYHILETGGETYSDLNSQAYEIISTGRTREPSVVLRTSHSANDALKDSFAPIEKVYSNIQGDSILIERVKTAWSELYNPESIYYHLKKGVYDFSTSIIVQKMLEVDAAGACLTLNPTALDDYLVVEACWGWFKPVKAGILSPTCYYVGRESLSIEKRQISPQSWMVTKDIRTGREIQKELSSEKSKTPVLNDLSVKKIAHLASRVEAHFGCPQIVEFVIESGRIYFTSIEPLGVQTRISQQVQQGHMITSGKTVSSGISEGTLRITELPEQISSGIVLLKYLKSSLIPILERVNGILSLKGAYSSDVAIAAREFNKPLIVDVANAQQLVDGMQVSVDGSSSMVYKIPQQQSVVAPFFSDIYPSEPMKSLNQQAGEVVLQLKFINSNGFSDELIKRIVLACKEYGVRIDIPEISVKKEVEKPSITQAFFSNGEQVKKEEELIPFNL